MEKLKVKYFKTAVKPLVMPKSEDVGIDITSAEDRVLSLNSANLISTGICIEIPEGYWLDIRDRSSNSEYFHVMAGIVDQPYRGELKVRLYCHTIDGKTGYKVNKGDKIAQLILMKNYNADFEIEKVKELSKTERDTKGFGSTGK